MDSGQAQLRQQIHTPSFTFNPNNKFRRDVPPRTTPIINMNGNDMPVKQEGVGAPAGVWTTPTSQGMRPRPATIHEGFSYSMSDDYGTLPSWDSSPLPMQQTPSDAMSRPVSVHQQDFYPVTTMENTWQQKPCEDNFEFHGLDTEMIGQAYTTDEAIPVLDLRYGQQTDSEFNFDCGPNPRRMSGSSFTMSTSGALSDMPSYEDFSAALSEAPSFSSDYPPPSNRNSLMSSTQLSPVASPRMTPQSRSELVRTQSRGRASPSPRPGMRSAPYSVERGTTKRWSTGSYGTQQNRRQTPFVFHPGHDAFGAHQRMSSRHSSPTIQHNQVPLNFTNLQAAQQHPFMMAGPPQFQRNSMNSMLLPSQLPSNGFPHPDAHHFEAPPPLLSHGLFRMLQSNADPHSLHSHYTDLSDPPDLYASLHEEQVPPPPEDMNPSDPDLVPHEQELRFEGDLYTPRWVRGHGNKREGWCGICKPGRWLVLKNSAFWYDKSFTHGISAATGNPFQEPQETRRMDGNPDVWEGLCGSCNDWIALVSSKKKGTTWFRHAYKCHTHPKIKDAPKRRRESSHNRNLAASQMAKPKVEPGQAPPMPQQTPITPQSAASVTSTPTPAQMQQQQQQQHQHQHQQQHLQQVPPMPQMSQGQMQAQQRGIINPLEGMPGMI
ncbi:Meiotic expression up-regulated protein 26 [Colletotrichum siamense]|uniref:Meiotic expression up-regulated protein 26 n=1 Tax=Colletotrichum siamense TaxID=690259 RepID=A0A9P5K3H6_COLSI|nr:Meiotic expression up-regulated protein 26 [Colletotrichum siamense]KAF4821401.1 Meiotic expression up-regulated protein 26 [Colletotrichum siamense]KAF4842162.1 Meiotic expression up-regulated protein 26 [Colletotrichum siamense]KAF4858284.1 Meiotic expression up-regulated protein 26 [Colletotrichum siamense]KAF5501307.1 Meiotic expression up-regulated protein 26 [Colletotrichum siamense]